MAKYNIPVTKGGQTIEVDTDQISEENYIKIVLMGLKHFVNVSMTKVTKANLPDDDARHTEALKIAAENVQKMYSGSLRMVGAKAAAGKTVSKSAERTLAMQEARLRVKAEIKRQGLKVSHVEAKEITRLANLVLEDPNTGPALLSAARAKLAEREASGLQGMNIVIPISEKKVKQAEGKKARAAERKAEEAEAEETAVEVPKGTPQAHVIHAQGNRPQPGARR